MLPDYIFRYEFDRHFVDSDSETDTPDYRHEFDSHFADLDVRGRTNPLPLPSLLRRGGPGSRPRPPTALTKHRLITMATLLSSG